MTRNFENIDCVTLLHQKILVYITFKTIMTVCSFQSVYLPAMPSSDLDDVLAVMGPAGWNATAWSN